MDRYEYERFMTERESALYAVQKYTCIDVGCRYMQGLLDVKDVADFLFLYARETYPGRTRSSRLVALGCWLAIRDGSALPERTQS